MFLPPKPWLYGITPSLSLCSETALLEKTEQALRVGMNLLQLRQKDVPFETLLPLAEKLHELCQKHGAVFLVNDDVYLAKACHADGVHLGQGDMPIAEAKVILGEKAIIGKTAKTIDQAKNAYMEGVHYLGCGAMFSSATKANALPMTKAGFTAVATATPLPIVAIGGIDAHNILELKGLPLWGVALCNALFGTEDTKQETQKLLSSLHCL